VRKKRKEDQTLSGPQKTKLQVFAIAVYNYAHVEISRVPGIGAIGRMKK
jgi:hypothetical protein